MNSDFYPQIKMAILVTVIIKQKPIQQYVTLSEPGLKEKFWLKHKIGEDKLLQSIPIYELGTKMEDCEFLKSGSLACKF